MPATDRKTRKEIRQAIGLALHAVDMDAGAITHTPSETAPSAAKIIDNALAFGAENEHRGKWVLATDAGSSVQIRRVIGSSPDERSLTVSVPFDAAPSTAWTYELWDEDVSPVMVHQFINDALSEVTRKGSITALEGKWHTGGGISQFRLDSAWSGVKDVNWRSRYVGEPFLSLDEPMSSLTANVTIIVDSEDYREGTGAARLAIDSAESSATSIAASSIAPVDARGYDRVEFWYKTNVPITSSALIFQLMQGSSAHVSLAISSNGGDSWIYHTASIATPEINSSLTGIRIRTGSSNQPSALTLWLDDVKLVRRDTEVWETLPRDFWTLDQGNRRLNLKPDARLPYAKLEVSVMRPPAALTTDAAVSEIDSQYLVNSVVAKVLRANADRRGSDADAAAKRAVGYEQLAQAQRLRWSMPGNVRWVED